MSIDLAGIAGDPEKYRATLALPTGAGPARLSEVAADFQLRDFSAIDPALRQLLGRDRARALLRAVESRSGGFGLREPRVRQKITTRR